MTYVWEQEVSSSEKVPLSQPFECSESVPHDFAWRVAGATVIYEITEPLSSVDGGNGPIAALDNDLQPGRCWAIDGSRGQIGIGLSKSVTITEITIEHVPQELAYDPRSAPRNLAFWCIVAGDSVGVALKSVPNLKRPSKIHPNLTFAFLSDGEYSIYAPNHRQTFKIPSSGHPVCQGLVVEILDNWGHNSTCIYGIRVHGF